VLPARYLAFSDPVRQFAVIYIRRTGELDQYASLPQFAKNIGKLANCIAAAVKRVSHAFSSPINSVRRSAN
jgi:hypothetical protein